MIIYIRYKLQLLTAAAFNLQQISNKTKGFKWNPNRSSPITNYSLLKEIIPQIYLIQIILRSWLLLESKFSTLAI